MEAVKRKRGYNLRQRYGLEIVEYDAMLKKQRGVCAICREKCSSKNHLSVDHSHFTGRVRALLCHHCNAGIGHFKESRTILRAAIKYLTRHRVDLVATE